MSESSPRAEFSLLGTIGQLPGNRGWKARSSQLQALPTDRDQVASTRPVDARPSLTRQRHHKAHSPDAGPITPRQPFFGFSGIAPVTVISAAFMWTPLLWTLVPIGALIAIGMYDSFQLRHAILRQYPILGLGRYLAERLRLEIQQYFVESNTNGTPFSRAIREIVYRRTKGQRDKLPFGTQLDV